MPFRLVLVSGLALGVTLQVAPAAENEPQPVAPESDAGMIKVTDFYVDRFEFPNVEGELPRVDVSWPEAQSLCRAQGKRLCREREWEMACRGPEGHLYGYGPSFEEGRCHTPSKIGGVWVRGPDRAPSGSFADCRSANGAQDMIGNVWEWTDGMYSPDRDWRVVRGGSWFHSVNLARADTRYGLHLDHDYRLDLIGFRCCRSADATDGGTAADREEDTDLTARAR